MRSKWVCLPRHTGFPTAIAANRELPGEPLSASKSTVNASGLTRIVCVLANSAMLGIVLVPTGFAQTSSDPQPANIVSNSPEGVKSTHIKPDNSASPDSDAIAVDPSSLLPDLPPVPRRDATLIGGTIGHLDRVRDHLTVNVFGGGRATVLFDPRTKVYRGLKEVTIADLREGERVYLDTILDGATVFARAIRLSGASALGESQGVVLKYRQDRGELTLRDGISPEPVRIRINGSTKFQQNRGTVSPDTLAPGSLISVAFSSDGNGRDLAREISILALPGARFTFSGQILHIDLRTGLLVLNSETDHKTYEIYMDRSRPPDENLRPGAKVTVISTFENSRYVAREVTILPESR